MPTTARIDGTFTFDTSATGVDSGPNSKSFKQSIAGALRFNVYDDANTPIVRAMMSDYSISVTDDYTTAGLPGAIDYLSADFNNRAGSPAPVVTVNEHTYTKTTILSVPFSWDSTAYAGPGEPALHATLPNLVLFPFIGTLRSPAASAFYVNSISPVVALAGDYNSDNKVDQSDFMEWQKAFGKSSDVAGYADGNGDGVVDTADYVVWRERQSAVGAGQATSVPEPNVQWFVVLATLVFACRRSRPTDFLIRARHELSRTGFSLVELLVVIAILGLMIALLLPAIQAARESSRASACRNNLKQIGIAFANYESTFGALPKGVEGRFDRTLFPSTMFGFSWWIPLLPYLEHSDIADQLDRTGANVGYVQLNAGNGKLANNFAPGSWFCPSSPVDKLLSAGGFRIAAPSYSGISGATNEDGFLESRNSRCCRSEGQISGGGGLIPNSSIRMKQITDGLSNTLLVGEQSDFAYTAAGQPKPIAAAFKVGWLTGTHAIGVPPDYGDWTTPSYNIATIRYQLNEHRYDLPGVYEDIGANNPLLSAHQGIVNLLYCDGSVHAMSNNLDLRILKGQATRDDGTASAVAEE